MLKQRRLRWIGHVKRVEEGGSIGWGEVGEVRVGGDGQWEGQDKVDWVCDGGYELDGSAGARGAGSTDVESSHHHPSNPILDIKSKWW